ncbi:hypothetical protein HZS_6766 [Henneguya salminicola]|nr:hypothetical protein HZS_6766 [Henneguya salminicola]
MIKLWVDRCFLARAGGFFNPRSLLIMDSMTSHKDMTVRARLNSSGANVAIIPPLDIAINHSFNCSVLSELDMPWLQ